MEERRKEPRRQSFLGGTIGFNDRRSTASCIVRNFAASGAKLEFLGATSAPAEFELTIPARGRSYRAEVRWRTAGALGIALEAGADVNDTTPLEREQALRELRRTNLALRERAVRDGAI